MPDSVQENSSRKRRQPRIASLFSNATLALLPVFACFLGGATQKWAEGIVFAIFGFYLLAKPPRASLGIAFNCVFVALLALALIAFAPAHWFLLPAWRSAMTDDFAIILPGTVSPQPWITAGAFVSLLGGMSWLYVVASNDSELRGVRFQFRLFVLGVITLAAISIALYLLHGALPFWINQRGFGPFQNRNQTADLLGITAIILLACAQDDLRRGRKRWLFWVVALSILVAAIIMNFSRAGIAILIAGSALWIFAVALCRRSGAPIAFGVSLLLLLGAAILVGGGETFERFHFHGFGSTGISTDFRWKIFHDTFDLIRASPWCGIGLGNFDGVFAIFRNQSFVNTRALHPESDWLWLWAEMGWLAVVLVCFGAFLLVRRVFPLQEGTNQRFRLAALVGATVFAGHGLVDVSAHRLGTAMAGLFLFGLALHRPLNLKPGRWIAVVFRLVGIVLLVSGVSWAIAAKIKMLLPGAVGVSNAKQMANSAINSRDFKSAIALTTRGLEWAPLDWQLYFARALGEVATKQPDPALDDFRRARFLEPTAYEVPFAEGTAWLPVRPVLAATAWREALRRAGARRGEAYSDMLGSAALHSKEVRHILEEVGLNEPDLALAYLSRVSGELFDHGLSLLFKRDPDLSSLSEPQRLALFSEWSERGNLDQLAQVVNEHPAWLPFAWFGIAKYHASKSDFRAAYDLTQRFGEAVALPRVAGTATLEELQQRYVTNPDFTTGYALYREQIQRDRIDDALNTARHFSERPNSPAYFHFLEAQCWATKENWERAWNAWLAYHNAAKK